jgi:hypothetical protein
VLCHTDPGYHNWLDTQGFAAGNLTYRNLLGAQRTEFATRLVAIEELAETLPADTPRVTAQQRAEQLHQRFDAVRRRFGL